MEPRKSVWLSDQTTTLPPSPELPFADTVAPCAIEHDAATAAGHGACAERAGNVDDVANRLARGRRLDLDRAAGCLDPAGDVDQRLPLRGGGVARKRDLQKPVAARIERHLLARAQAD